MVHAEGSSEGMERQTEAHILGLEMSTSKIKDIIYGTGFSSTERLLLVKQIVEDIPWSDVNGVMGDLNTLIEQLEIVIADIKGREKDSD